MPGLIDISDLQAEGDMRILMEANKIQRDPTRLRSAQEIANRKMEEFKMLSQDMPGVPSKQRFDGAVQNNKMKR